MPGSITGSTNDSRLSSANGRPGVPLSDAADAEAKGPRVYAGTGQFTAEGNNNGNSDSGRAQSKVDANGVTLNLVGASVQEVAKTVLGDILQLNYTVSDKIFSRSSFDTGCAVLSVMLALTLSLTV